ncbi:hypothetical protein K443DRAFT_3444 [Laccaria amethystina LaAM-08-1]|uniref:Uncharacterized protein n=1 Tax=Laccaria amethystina LaAM-08-1 TaxID=1095629 RepID=A0A0C9Y7G2_9AGAR|nr:hypothetical protein K443DRAFT_3444 [Laccaria amethystina LaAM-08-1]
MKVYLPAIAGHVPTEMVQCISAFLDVCYIIRHADITVNTLKEFDTALTKFHQHHEVFPTTGVQSDSFNLPRQHTLSHYRHLIEEFGAPKGICSSITESRHITAVKKPWRRSIQGLTDHIGQPHLPELTCRFLFDQLNPNAFVTSDQITLHQCPQITSPVSAFHSATATFYVPSDESGIHSWNAL